MLVPRRVPPKGVFEYYFPWGTFDCWTFEHDIAHTGGIEINPWEIRQRFLGLGFTMGLVYGTFSRGPFLGDKGKLYEESSVPPSNIYS